MTPPSMSAYLPHPFDGGTIGLIAGKGRYPALTAERILQAGLPLRIVAFHGETDPSVLHTVPPEARAEIKVGQLGKLLKTLVRLKCRHALMAGQITPKRLFHGLHPDLKALRILNRLEEKNAETIFGAIAEEIKAVGIHLLDARAFLDPHLASPGLMTPGRLRAAAGAIRHGIRIAKGAAGLDIGQGVVVRKGTVLAVEAYEGTDAMLRRAGTFKTDAPIFVKTVKRQQDYRFDVPVFGHRTLEVMAEADIRSAVLEAGRVIMLDKPDLLAKAHALGIELYGFEAES